MTRKRRIAEGEVHQNNGIDNDYSYDAVGEMSLPLTRNLDGLYASYETLNCATERECIPCAYKIGCFDVALDKEFTKSTPNQRPEQCPRSSDKIYGNGSGSVLGFQRGMSILTVGDGDFSFSLGLARLLLLRPFDAINKDDNICHEKDKNKSDDGTYIIATSYESESTLREIYPNFDQTLCELDDLGVTVAFNVDATHLQETLSISDGTGNSNARKKFHRICWNFPCTNIVKGQDGQNREMEKNKSLVRNFVKSAQNILTNRGDGEIYICHKTKPPFNQWNLEEVALENIQQQRQQQQLEQANNAFSPRPLFYTGRIVLDRFLLPPYTPRKALDRKSFPCHDACFYIFAQTKSERGEEQNQGRQSNETKPGAYRKTRLFPPTIQYEDGDNASTVELKVLADMPKGRGEGEVAVGQKYDSTKLIKIHPDIIHLIRRRHIHVCNGRKKFSTPSAIKKRKEI